MFYKASFEINLPIKHQQKKILDSGFSYTF